MTVSLWLPIPLCLVASPAFYALVRWVIVSGDEMKRTEMKAPRVKMPFELFGSLAPYGHCSCCKWPLKGSDTPNERSICNECFSDELSEGIRQAVALEVGKTIQGAGI